MAYMVEQRMQNPFKFLNQKARTTNKRTKQTEDEIDEIVNSAKK